MCGFTQNKKKHLSLFFQTLLSFNQWSGQRVPVFLTCSITWTKNKHRWGVQKHQTQSNINPYILFHYWKAMCQDLDFLLTILWSSIDKSDIYGIYLWSLLVNSFISSYCDIYSLKWYKAGKLTPCILWKDIFIARLKVVILQSM